VAAAATTWTTTFRSKQDCRSARNYGRLNSTS
jgi:hypothetical protein